MPITTEVVFRLSGGSGNTDPAASLGGAKSSTAVTGSTIFDTVSGAESAAGDTEYRCIYVHNGHGSLSALSAKIWVQAASPAYISIALGGEGLNGTAETVGNESTAPSGESFSTPTDLAGGLSMGDIPAGQHYPVWVRRVVPSAASAASATFTLRVGFDTAA